MPQYHNHESESGYIDVKITPLPRIRQFFPALPYYVGDCVSFRLNILLSSSSMSSMSLYESFGGGAYYPISELGNEVRLVGNIINKEGDVEYRIAPTGHPDDGYTIFTARVINKDTIFFQWFWFVLGVISTLAVGIVLWLLGSI